MAAIKSGFTAYQNYDQKNLIPSDRERWDTIQARSLRYALGDYFYYNMVFTTLVQFAEQHKTANQHYKHIRSIYNPVGRQVDQHVYKVWPGPIDWVTMEGGAIPITAEQNLERIIDALRKLYRWSNIENTKDRIPRNGALKGDSPIKIVDEPEKGRVRLEPLNPGIFQDVEFDPVGNVRSCRIAYYDTDANGKRYLYTETIDKGTFATFKDDKPWDYRENVAGGMYQWDNPYGFVPVRWTRHIDVGRDFGMSCYHRNLPKIEELMGLASRIHDQIAKTINPIWAVTGVNGDIKVEMGENGDRDHLPLIDLGPHGKMEPIGNSLDIEAALAALDRQQEEIERDSPELALHLIRKHGDMTLPGITAGFSDAISVFRSSQATYNATLIAANQMAIAIGGFRGYDGFQGFNLDSYDKGDLEHGIKPHPIIEDALSKGDRIRMLLQLGSGEVDNQYADIILREMGISDNEIEDSETKRLELKLEGLQQQLALRASNQAEALNVAAGLGVDIGTATAGTEQIAPGTEQQPGQPGNQSGS